MAEFVVTETNCDDIDPSPFFTFLIHIYINDGSLHSLNSFEILKWWPLFLCGGRLLIGPL
jgi:hypothetical protein